MRISVDKQSLPIEACSNQLIADRRKAMYENIMPMVESLVDPNASFISNLANITSVLKYDLRFFWVGFYLVEGDKLVLGPFQGSTACTTIAKGKGVCGRCWEENRTIIVSDVRKYEGHIACNSKSRSEIVIPVRRDGQVSAILDVDSNKVDDFNEVDQVHLEKIIEFIR